MIQNFTIVPGAISVTYTSAYGNGLTCGTVGMSSSFLIKTRDQFNNPSIIDKNVLFEYELIRIGASQYFGQSDTTRRRRIDSCYNKSDCLFWLKYTFSDHFTLSLILKHQELEFVVRPTPMQLFVSRASVSEPHFKVQGPRVCLAGMEYSIDIADFYGSAISQNTTFRWKLSQFVNDMTEFPDTIAYGEANSREHVTFMIAERGLYRIDAISELGRILNSPFLFECVDCLACSHPIQLRGNGLTVATAGVEARFRVSSALESKDFLDVEYAATLGPISEKKLFPSVKIQESIKVVSWIATRSSSYVLQVGAMIPRYILATYYDSPDSIFANYSGHIYQNFTNKSLANASVTNLNRILWKSYIRGPVRGEIYAMLNIDQNVNYVNVSMDGRSLFEAWIWTKQRLFSKVIVFDDESRWHEIIIFTIQWSVDFCLDLRWIPSMKDISLYKEFTLYSFFSLNQDSYQAEVYPGAVCGFSSFLQGSGLTASTAGMLSYFSLITRDEFGNCASSQLSILDIELIVDDANIDLVELNLSAGSHCDYYAWFTLSRSGEFSLQINLILNNGLWATYYLDPVLGQPTKIQWEENVNLSTNDLTSNDYKSVRWEGQLVLDSESELLTLKKNPSSELIQGHDDCASVFIDKRDVINLCQDQSAISSSYGEYELNHEESRIFEIEIRYQSLSKDKMNCQLGWSSTTRAPQVVPKRAFRGAVTLLNTPEFTVYPFPEVSPSIWATGNGLTLATAGVYSQFSLMSFDRFGNLMNDTKMVMQFQSLDFEIDTKLVFLDPVTPPLYVFKFDEAGDYSIHITSYQTGNITAFLYEQMDGISVESGNVTINTDACMWTIDDASTVLPPCEFCDFLLVTSGFLRLETAEKVFFQASLPTEADRIKLWINGEMVIDQWSSLSNLQLSTPHLNLPCRSIQSFTIMQSHQNVTGNLLKVRWLTTNSSGECITTSYLLAPIPSISTQPIRALKVMPSTVCNSQSILSGQGLSIGTKGSFATFTIVMKDSFNNSIAPSSYDLMLNVLEEFVFLNYFQADSNGKSKIGYLPSKVGFGSNLTISYLVKGLHATYYVDEHPHGAVDSCILDGSFNCMNQNCTILLSGYLQISDGPTMIVTQVSGLENTLEMQIDQLVVVKQPACEGICYSSGDFMGSYSGLRKVDIRYSFKNSTGALRLAWRKFDQLGAMLEIRLSCKDFLLTETDYTVLSSYAIFPALDDNLDCDPEIYFPSQFLSGVSFHIYLKTFGNFCDNLFANLSRGILELQNRKNILKTTLVTVVKSENVSISLTESGQYSLSLVLTVPGGLVGLYFDQMHCREISCTPVSISLEPSLQFSWSDNNAIIKNGSFSTNSYATVQLKGYLLPEFTARYLFFLNAIHETTSTRCDWCHNLAQVYINDVQILNSDWNMQAPESSATFDFVGNQFYKIELVYRQYRGSSRLKLEWMSQNVSRDFSIFCLDEYGNQASAYSSFLLQLQTTFMDIEGSLTKVSKLLTPVIGTNMAVGGFNVSKAGQFDVFVHLLLPGIRIFAQNCSISPSTLWMNGVNASLRDSLFQDCTFPIAVVWSGYLRFDFSGLYTFQTAILGSEDRVKLWIDQSLVIEQWTSLSQPSPSEIWNVWINDSYAPFVLEYLASSDTFDIAFQWKNDNMDWEVIPKENLFHGQILPTAPFSISVFPGSASERSIAFGDGLTCATSGLQAQFTIRALDLFRNFASFKEDSFNIHFQNDFKYLKVEVTPIDESQSQVTFVLGGLNGLSLLGVYIDSAVHISGSPWSLLVNPGSLRDDAGVINVRNSVMKVITTLTAGISSQFVLYTKDSFNTTIVEQNPELLIAKFDLNDGSRSSLSISQFRNLSVGQYAASVQITRSGAYIASIGTLAGSGLSANVFSASNYFLSVKDNMAISLNGPPIADLGWNQGFEITWTGFIVIPYQGNVTFQSYLANSQDRLAFWIDNELISDQWSSIHSLTSSWNFYSSSTDSSHIVLVTYLHRYGYCTFDIKWSWSGVDMHSIPLAQLFSQLAHNQGSPFNISIIPDFPRAAVCSGSGLTIAVVGNFATFGVYSKDTYGNPRVNSNDLIVLRILQNRSGAMTWVYPVQSIIKANDRHNVNYLALTAAGYVQLYASVFSQVGLLATYYDLNEQPGKIQVLDSFASSSVYSCGDSNSLLTVKMQGYLFNLTSGEYDFVISLGQDNERVRMWFDGIVLINQWDSLTSQEIDTTYLLTSDERIVEVQIEYKYNVSSTGLQVRWIGPGFGWQNMQSVFFDGGILGSPFELQIVTSTSESNANLSGTLKFGSASSNLLLYLTSISQIDSLIGQALTYQLQIRDAFGNIIFPNCGNGLETFCAELPLVTKSVGDNVQLGSSFVSSTFDSQSPFNLYPQLHTMSGFLASSNAGIIRFALLTSTRAQLYVDNDLVINFPGYSQQNESFGQKWFPSTHPLSILLVHHVTSQSDAELHLFWSSGLSSFSEIPLSNLYYQANLARAFRESVVVSQSSIEMLGSVLFGDGMSYVIANTQSVFHLLARDQFENTFCDLSLHFQLSLTVDGIEEKEIQPLPVSGGRIDAFFSVISSGLQTLVLSQMIESSISSTFYNIETFDPILTDNSSSQITEIVMEPTSTKLQVIGMLQPLIIRWSAFVRPSQADEYLIFLELPSEHDRIKLWIDSQLKVDMWNSLSNVEILVKHEFRTVNQYHDIQMLFRQDNYSNSNATFRFSWHPWTSLQNMSIMLFTRVQVVNSSVLVLESWSHCWSQSTLSIGGGILICYGNALKIESRYILTLQNVLRKLTLPANPINSTHLSFLLPPFWSFVATMQLTASDDEAVIYQDFACRVLLSIKPKKSLTSGFAAVTLFGIGLLESLFSLNIVRGNSWSEASFTYLPIVEEVFDNSRISFSMPGQKQNLDYFSNILENGLFATFYQSADLRFPRSSRLVPDIDFSIAYRGPLPGSLEYGESSIRWSGLLKSDIPSMYTIQLSTLDIDERVRLWVDNALLIDSWESLNSQDETALFRFSSERHHFEIKIEYQQISGSFGLKLSWNTNLYSQTIIPHDNLYPPGDFYDAIVNLRPESQGIFATYYGQDTVTPFQSVWHPEPILDNALQRTGIGAIKWEGFLRPSFSEVYTFTTALNDMSDRINIWIDETLLFEQWQSLDSTVLQGTIFFDADSQSYSRVDFKFYTPSVSQLSYDVQPQVSGSTDFAFSGTPSITAVLPLSGPTTGGTQVTVFGLNLGPSKTMIQARIGGTNALVIAQPTQEVCKLRLPSGVGRSLELYLNVDGVEGFAYPFLKFSYSFPHFQSTGTTTTWPGNLESNFASTGSISFTVSGSGFGTQDFSTASRFAHTSIEASKWTSDSTIVSMIAAGVGGTVEGVITVARQWNTRTSFFTFDHPSLSASYPMNRASTGSSYLTLFGGNFFSNNISPKIRLFPTATEETYWISDTGTRSISAAAAAASKQQIVTVLIQLSSISEQFTMDFPKPSNFKRANVPSTGSSSITLQGMNLRTASTTIGVTCGTSKSQATKWQSDTSLVSLRAWVSLGSLQLSVTSTQNIGTITALQSYDKLQASAFRPTNGIGTGSSYISVHGSSLAGFSNTNSARNGFSACERSLWLSTTSICCLESSSISFSQRVIVTIGISVGSKSNALSYIIPSLQLVYPTNNPPEGKILCTVEGEFFGMFADSQEGRLGGSSCERSVWKADTSLYCKSPAGIQGTRQIVVSSGIQDGSRTEIFSYDIEGITKTISSNLATTGSVQFTIMGYNFGFQDYTQRMQVGVSATELTVWTSDSSVASLSPSGVQRSHSLTLTVGEQIRRLTNTRIVTYDQPGLSNLCAANVPSTSSVHLTVLGKNLGITSYSLTIRNSRTRCEETMWISETSTMGRITDHTKFTKLTMLTAGSTVGTTTQSWSTDKSTITTLTTMNSPITGSNSITVHGENLANARYSIKTRAGSTATTSTEWQSDTSIPCQTTALATSSARVAVTVGERDGSGTEA
eukprot:768590-Hanusia_phi.AAC.1